MSAALDQFSAAVSAMAKASLDAAIALPTTAARLAFLRAATARVDGLRAEAADVHASGEMAVALVAAGAICLPTHDRATEHEPCVHCVQAELERVQDEARGGDSENSVHHRGTTG